MRISLINALHIYDGAHFLPVAEFGCGAQRAAVRPLVCGKLESNSSF